MTKTDVKPVTITGRVAVLVSKYASFDLNDTGKTPVDQFAYVSPNYINKDGNLNHDWAKDGKYRHVGWADISIQILPVKQMMSSAISALEAEKKHVLATAQAEATRIEVEIQKLLAITYDAEVQS